jgi:hypothetical protein
VSDFGSIHRRLWHDDRSMRSWLLPVVACVVLLAATAHAQVFKPRTGSAARPAPVKTAAAPTTVAAAPAKKPTAPVATAAAKKPPRHAGKKHGKKRDADEDTVVVDDNDGDTDDVKVTDD